ncbi:hypothetical protein [Kribbella jiaozuonensis]|uniref:Uncharacterized protein n=1 Tax=Kribbella jiaozuonensis TaxID=2575441 RepID=A0A4U3LWE1_9ACTN|nr:hypothetical protein [Kribbella jiaozuonensis]TKK80132.1 hypothetical protein FDA38_17505 [Kribbella jiaozuonensis]
MDTGVQTALIGAGAGLLSGGIASLVAPWVTWQLERRRQLHKDRLAMLAEWREGLREAESNSPQMDRLRSFLTTPWYKTLRPHLNPSLRDDLELTPILAGSIGTPVIKYRQDVAVLLNDEIDRIAKEWDMA